MSKQKTIKQSFTLQGKGLHTGLNVTLTFHPAPANFGYKVKRIDIPEQIEIDAVGENVKDFAFEACSTACASCILFDK